MVILALEDVVVKLTALLPKLIIALIIWYIGKYLLDLSLSLIGKLDTHKSEEKQKTNALAASLIEVIGRIVMVLVILDYLGIGKTVIAAITQGFTFAIGIALGLAFGKALEEDAKKILGSLKSLFGN